MERTKSDQRPKGPVVLLVEDVPDLRILLGDILVREGFVVIEAKDGREAVDKARSLRPDAIVMDLMLPLLGGAEAARSIRAIEGLRDLPIIALTGQPMKPVDRESFYATLTKPCVPDVLVWRLRTALARRRSAAS